MTPRDSACGQPDTAQRAVSLDRLDRVRRTSRIIPARSGKDRRNRDLVSANAENEQAPDDHASFRRRSGGGRESSDDRADIRRQPDLARLVRFAPSSDRDVARRFALEGWKQLEPRKLTQPALEPVAFDSGVVMSWHDDTNPRKRQRGSEHADVEIRGADSPPLLNHLLNVEAMAEPGLARKSEAALRRRRTCSAA